MNFITSFTNIEISRIIVSGIVPVRGILYRKGFKMAKASSVICGIQIDDMLIMQAKFDGFDPHSCTKFKAGDTIAYKNKNDLSMTQIKHIFPNGKTFNLTVCWPLKQAGKKFDIYTAPISPSIDNYMSPVPAKTFTPSEYQESILDTLLNAKDHMLIEALAGSGKTSTLVWLVKELHKRGMTKQMKIIYLAFNKSIQEELSEQLHGTGVPAQTTHSFGFNLLKKRFGDNISISENRTSDTFIKMLCDEKGYNYSFESFKAIRKSEIYKIRQPVLELVGYVKNWGICPCNGQFSSADRMAVAEFIRTYEIEFDNTKFTEESVVDYACRTVAMSIPQPGESLSEVSYDDMLYLPIVLDLPVPKFDLVLTDESQDFNFLQKNLLLKLAKA
jgi:hypothetical protein